MADEPHLLAPPRVLVVLLGLFLPGLFLPAPVRASTASPSTVQALPRSAGGDFNSELDSTQVSAEARAAQARFERLRRRNAPWTNGAWSGACDETIGRFCIWHTPESDWAPPDDSPPVVEGREALLDELAALDEAGSGDAWLLGQRVRYLGEAGRWKEAERLVAACGPGDDAWCAALLGFIHHGAGDYPAAEQAFERALEAMPPERAEEWSDPSILLDPQGRRLLQPAPGAPRDEMRTRIWWLADPLYLIDGNERWTEHLARHVMAALQEEARNPHGMRWGDDMEEIVLRFGWSIAWERVRPGPYATLEPERVVGRERPGALRFLPLGSALAHAGGVDDDGWRLDDPTPPSKYAARQVRHVHPLPHQVALFPRGDTLLVVATLEVPRPVDGLEASGPPGPPEPLALSALPEPTGPPGLSALPEPPDGREGVVRRSPTLETGLFLVPEGLPIGGAPTAGTEWMRLDSPRAGDGSSAPRPHTFLRKVPRGRYILGLEAWVPAADSAWRHRREIIPAPWTPGVPATSDLLLHRPSDEPPGSVEDAAARALPTGRISRSEPLGVAWELYELVPRQAISFRIAVEPEEGGRLRRLGQWIGIVDAPSSIVIGWTEAGPDRHGTLFRTAELDLRAIDPGRYTLSLEVRLPGRAPVQAGRPLEILP